MKPIITEKDLKELKIRAKGGSAEKRMDYVKAKREFDRLKNEYFDGEDYPYTSAPDNTYVERLRQEAEESEDEKAQIRYAMMKANREDLDRRIAGDDVKDFRLKREQVKRAVEEENKVTKKQVEEAKEVAAQNPTPGNVAAYSLLKRRYAETK